MFNVAVPSLPAGIAFYIANVWHRFRGGESAIRRFAPYRHRTRGARAIAFSQSRAQTFDKCHNLLQRKENICLAAMPFKSLTPEWRVVLMGRHQTEGAVTRTPYDSCGRCIGTSCESRRRGHHHCCSECSNWHELRASMSSRTRARHST